MPFKVTDWRSALLPNKRSRRREDRLALRAVLCSAVLFLALIPFARTVLAPVPSFVLVSETALLIFDLMTAVFLFGQYVVLRSRSLYVLACGYVFAGLIEGVHALTFPGAFAAGGLLGARPQTTAWLYVFWHCGFPLFLIAYALLGRARSEPDEPSGDPARRQGIGSRDKILLGVATVLAVVGALTWLAMSGTWSLPPLIVDNIYTPAVGRLVSVGALLSLLSLATLLWKRRGSVLDLWLMVVASAWFFDLALSGIFSAARYDLGWYAGRVYGLSAAAVLLTYLLVDSLEHHAGLVRTSLALSAVNAGLEQRVADRTSELVLARDAAESADRAKSAFLATMSHEIRTPMNGVVGMAEVLLHRQLPEHLVDAVRTIRSSAFALLGIIDDILDFSKIEAGHLELERMVVDLPELVENACATLLPVAAANNVYLHPFISPRLPVQIWSDPTRLRQILFNLVSNAIKFSAGDGNRPGRVSIRVELSDDPSPRLVLRVSDNGIGIDPAVQALLFRPFMQAESSTTRRFGGTGLGLTIVKRLATLMHGDVDVRSVFGAGATFTVNLPLEAGPDIERQAGVDLAGVACLIVGASETIDDMRVYLEHAGAVCRSTSDLAAAAVLAVGMDAPVVVQVHGRDTPSPAALRAAFATVPRVSHVLVVRDPAHGFANAADLVVVDGNCLRRDVLVQAVAAASGRAAGRDPLQIEGNRWASDSAAVPSVDEAHKQGRLILIAEDDEVNQKVIRQQIHMLGYAAVIAGNGAEAFRLWREGRFALLLTDLHMPEMDGYSLTQAIRAHETASRVEEGARMPILALTANAMRGEALRARAAGMDDYLTKPMQLRSLKLALRKWLPLERPDTMPAELLGET